MTGPAPRLNVQADSVVPVLLSLRSRLILWVLRWLVRPAVGRMLRGGRARIQAEQLKMSQRPYQPHPKLALDYRVLGVPGHVLGEPGADERPVVLWLHGGAFIMPAVPDLHLKALERLCLDIDAAGFMPDYRLAPSHPFPAGLDDCERAYRHLLDMGIPAQRIVLGGDSAGGNLVLGLLQRIREHDWPMPSCATAVAPVTDLTSQHGLPSRRINAGRDAMLPLTELGGVIDMYLDGSDASHPEISPLFGSFEGFPPLLLMASDAEILRDDSVLLAGRMQEQGVDVQIKIWAKLPHVYPLLEGLLPEAVAARQGISSFMSQQIRKSENCAEVASSRI